MQTQTPKGQSSSLLSDPPPNSGPERRLTPRKAWVADINFEPNNGGIVLNLSEGGLGFRSIAPVQPNGPIRFWFSLNNQRVQASGELAWIDASQKTGGLRFTALPAETREQIRHWTTQPGSQFHADDVPARSASTLRRLFALASIRPDANQASALSSSLPLIQSKFRALAPWSWFSGGLALGLVLSAFIASALLFRTNRRQLGESIIHFGERVAAKPTAQNQPVSSLPGPAAAPEAVAPATIPVAQPAEPSRTIPNSPPFANPATIEPSKPQPSKPESASAATPTTWPPFAAPVPRPKLSANAGTSVIAAVPPAVPSHTIAVAPDSTLLPAKSAPLPPLDSAKYASAFVDPSIKQDPDQPAEMYFEVGRFKDHFAAKRTQDKLTQLGFPAAVVQKSRFWSNAYRVIVGPYRDDAEAKIGQRSLLSRGFNPQPFERGSRNFSLSHVLTVNGKSTPLGECIIRWESYSSKVVVQFLQGKYAGTTVDAKWVPRGVRYDRAAYVYIKGGDGSRNLAEIRFAGMDRALVFLKLR